MAQAAASVVDIGTLIECLPGVYGGRPRLTRSGLPIIQLVADYRSGMRVSDLLEAYPFVDEESIYAGIAYYLANRDALDAELDEHDREGATAALRQLCENVVPEPGVSLLVYVDRWA